MLQGFSAFLPNTHIRCMNSGREFGGVITEDENGNMLVGNSGKHYMTLEDFYVIECGGSHTEDPWEICEFWKSWCWWKCKEMLSPT